MGKIKLTSTEQKLYKKFKSFDIKDDYQERIDALNAAKKLTESLISRSAIPKNRKKFFLDKDFNPGRGNKSRKEIFESNGTTGSDIYEHGNFRKYLDYFINGADVSQKLSNFAAKTFEENVYQDEARDEIITFIMKNNLRPSDKSERKKFAKEVFKLATDLGFQSHYCNDLRKKML